MPSAYPRNVKTLGDKLRKKRLDVGLLQSEVALRLEVSTSSVKAWEANRAKPMRRTISRIRRFLDS